MLNATPGSAEARPAICVLDLSAQLVGHSKNKRKPMEFPPLIAGWAELSAHSDPHASALRQKLPRHG